MPRVMDVHVSPNILKFLLRLSNVTGWFGKRHICPYVSSQMWTISIKSGRTLAICLALTKSLTTRMACGLVLSCRVMGFWCLRKNDKTCRWILKFLITLLMPVWEVRYAYLGQPMAFGDHERGWWKNVAE